jgi:hypothetical protein|tara:strand:+ start:124 stop:1068 length:945 start_codon:yes stop_codon:yes gene_type:complete
MEFEEMTFDNATVDLDFTPEIDDLYHGNHTSLRTPLVPTHKAIVHPDGNVLGVVGKGYRVIPNTELFSNMDDAIHNNLSTSAIDTMQVIDTKVRGYAKTYREIRFPEISRPIETDSHKTDVGFRIIIENSFDGSGSVKILLGAIDFYCSNGMVHGQYDVFKKVHKGNVPVPSFEGMFVKALEQYSDKMDLYQNWASTKLSDKAVHNFVSALFPTTKKNDDPEWINVRPYSNLGDSLIEQYATESHTRGQNLWSLYSAMTYYSSHDSDMFSLNTMSKDQDNDQERLARRSDKVTGWLNSKAWSDLTAFPVSGIAA